MGNKAARLIKFSQGLPQKTSMLDIVFAPCIRFAKALKYVFKDVQSFPLDIKYGN